MYVNEVGQVKNNSALPSPSTDLGKDKLQVIYLAQPELPNSHNVVQTLKVFNLVPANTHDIFIQHLPNPTLYLIHTSHTKNQTRLYK